MMNESIRALEPKALWNHFADLNAVPRPSKKEERVIAFIKKFGEDLGLQTQVDQAGNVIIKKPGTKGKERKHRWLCRATWTWCIRRTMTRSSTSTLMVSA